MTENNGIKELKHTSSEDLLKEIRYRLRSGILTPSQILAEARKEREAMRADKLKCHVCQEPTDPADKTRAYDAQGRVHHKDCWIKFVEAQIKKEDEEHAAKTKE